MLNFGASSSTLENIVGFSRVSTRKEVHEEIIRKTTVWWSFYFIIKITAVRRYFFASMRLEIASCRAISEEKASVVGFFGKNS